MAATSAQEDDELNFTGKGNTAQRDLQNLSETDIIDIIVIIKNFDNQSFV